MPDIKSALDIEFESDTGLTTPRRYLKSLLSELLCKGESFSSKRPFGNSGWEDELATPLIKAGLLAGEIDEYGYASGFNRLEYARLLQKLNDAAFGQENSDGR